MVETVLEICIIVLLIAGTIGIVATLATVIYGLITLRM